jgi:hypothetical protein
MGDKVLRLGVGTCFNACCFCERQAAKSGTRMRVRIILASSLLLLSSGGAHAQQPAHADDKQTTPTTMTQQPNTPPAANPKDVASIDAILNALYEVISGRAGQPRDWQRFRSLFVPGARLIPTAHQPDGITTAHVLTPEDYVERGTKIFATQGFYERGIANRVEQFGRIAHVFSTYEARHDLKDAQPFLRGINSIQLMNDGRRWWVVSVFWQAEDKDTPLPEKYLKP